MQNIQHYRRYSTHMMSTGKRWHRTDQQQTVLNGRHYTSPLLDLQATVCYDRHVLSLPTIHICNYAYYLTTQNYKEINEKYIL